MNIRGSLLQRPVDKAPDAFGLVSTTALPGPLLVGRKRKNEDQSENGMCAKIQFYIIPNLTTGSMNTNRNHLQLQAMNAYWKSQQNYLLQTGMSQSVLHERHQENRTIYAIRSNKKLGQLAREDTSTEAYATDIVARIKLVLPRLMVSLRSLAQNKDDTLPLASSIMLSIIAILASI